MWRRRGGGWISENWGQMGMRGHGQVFGRNRIQHKEIGHGKSACEKTIYSFQSSIGATIVAPFHGIPTRTTTPPTRTTTTIILPFSTDLLRRVSSKEDCKSRLANCREPFASREDPRGWGVRSIFRHETVLVAEKKTHKSLPQTSFQTREVCLRR